MPRNVSVIIYVLKNQGQIWIQPFTYLLSSQKPKKHLLGRTNRFMG